MGEKKSKALMFLVITVVIIFILFAGAATYQFYVTPNESWHSCSSVNDCTDETVCYDLPINKRFKNRARLNQSLLPYMNIQCWDRGLEPKRDIECKKASCSVVFHEPQDDRDEWDKCTQNDDCIAVRGRSGRYFPSNKKYEEKSRSFWNSNLGISESLPYSKYDIVVTEVRTFCKKRRCEVKEKLKKVKRKVHVHEGENPFAHLFKKSK